MPSIPEVVSHPFKYAWMPLEDRKKLLPERNVCSLYPAKEHCDYFWTGDGFQRVDEMGDPYDDVFFFLQEALFEPKWAKTPEPPDLTGIMPEVRRLLLEGKFTEAADLVEKVQIEAGFGEYMYCTSVGAIMPLMHLHPHKAFLLSVKQPEAGKTKNFLRWLNLLSGKITVQWENDRGAFARETIAAYKGDIIAQRFTAPKGALDNEITLMLPNNVSFDDYLHSGVVHPELCSYELDVAYDLFTLKWAYPPELGRKGYVSVIRFVRCGGKVEKTQNGIRIIGADSLLILSKTVKFEGDFTFECAGPVVDEIMAVEPDFDALLAYNREYLGSRMERSRIRLGSPEDFALSGEELLQRTHSDIELDGTMLEKLYDMGRFYTIIDTGAIPPLWGQHNINTNLQVSSGNNTGLFDEMDVYYRFYETKFDDFRTNARKLFGARGLLATVHCDYDSGLLYQFSKTYPHYAWTGCLGWIYNELWNYWLVSGDKEFLRKRIVPALKEIALFFEDYACDRGPDGHALFYPSYSPEEASPTAFTQWTMGHPPKHTPEDPLSYATLPGVYATNINSLMDVMVCREVLDNLINACGELGIEQENIVHWEEQRSLLPRYLLDEEGGLKEWAWAASNENYDHRHVSHHYGLWPGREVTWEETPELARAIQISNHKRAGQDDSVHGLIHRCLCGIRLKDITETVSNLYELMNHGFVARSLHTNHMPYRVHWTDLQGAMPTMLIEMAVYSAPGTVEFLPAMPASLGKGAIEGIWLFTWAKLERMNWSEKDLKATIVSNRAQTLTLRCRKPIRSFQVSGSEIPVEGNHIKYTFMENETAEVYISFLND